MKSIFFIVVLFLVINAYGQSDFAKFCLSYKVYSEKLSKIEKEYIIYEDSTFILISKEFPKKDIRDQMVTYDSLHGNWSVTEDTLNLYFNENGFVSDHPRRKFLIRKKKFITTPYGQMRTFKYRYREGNQNLLIPNSSRL